MKTSPFCCALEAVILIAAISSDCPAGRLYWSSITRTPGVLAYADTGTVPLQPTLVPGNHGNQPEDVAPYDSLGLVFYTVGHELRRVNLDGTDQRVLDDSVLSSVAVDPVDRKVYWTGLGGVIRRADLNGANAETIAILDRPAFTSLALDAVHRKLYWATNRYDGNPLLHISMSDLDGSNVHTIAEDSFERPYSNRTRYWDITVDPLGRKVYWAAFQHTGQNYRIERANLDGSNVEVFLAFDDIDTFPNVTEFEYPRFLAIDVAEQKLYWGLQQFRNDRIMRADLNSSHIEEVYRGGSGLRNIAFSTYVPEPNSWLLLLTVCVLSAGVLKWRRLRPTALHASGTLTEAANGRAAGVIGPVAGGFELLYPHCRLGGRGRELVDHFAAGAGVAARDTRASQEALFKHVAAHRV